MKTLKNLYFQYAELVTKFVNENQVEVISITRSDGFEGFMLFYYEKN